MPSSISNTSSFHSAYIAPEHDDRQSSTSGSQRNLPSNASLGRLASRLSTAGGSFVSAVGGERTPAAGSDVGSSVASPTHSVSASEYGSVAESVYESATSRSLTPSLWASGSAHSSGSDWIDMNFSVGGRGSNASRLSAASSEHQSSNSGWIDIDPHATGRRSVAGSEQRSEIAEVLSQAGTPSERSFHLSERGSVVEALGNGRLGYSSASSRRLTSYEGSSEASSARGSVAGSRVFSHVDSLTLLRNGRRGSSSAAGSIVPSYVSSLTPSDLSAVRAARRGGRLAPPSSLPSAPSSLDSEYSAYLREGDDMVAPLPPSQFRPAPSAAPSDPYSVASGTSSRRIDRTPSLSRRLSDSGRSSRFGGADVESLSAAGSRRHGEGPRPLWQFLKEDH